MLGALGFNYNWRKSTRMSKVEFIDFGHLSISFTEYKATEDLKWIVSHSLGRKSTWEVQLGRE